MEKGVGTDEIKKESDLTSTPTSQSDFRSSELATGLQDEKHRTSTTDVEKSDHSNDDSLQISASKDVDYRVLSMFNNSYQSLPVVDLSFYNAFLKQESFPLEETVKNTLVVEQSHDDVSCARDKSLPIEERLKNITSMGKEQLQDLSGDNTDILPRTERSKTTDSPISPDQRFENRDRHLGKISRSSQKVVAKRHFGRRGKKFCGGKLSYENVGSSQKSKPSVDNFGNRTLVDRDSHNEYPRKEKHEDSDQHSYDDNYSFAKREPQDSLHKGKKAYRESPSARRDKEQRDRWWNRNKSPRSHFGSRHKFHKEERRDYAESKPPPRPSKVNRTGKVIYDDSAFLSDESSSTSSNRREKREEVNHSVRKKSNSLQQVFFAEHTLRRIEKWKQRSKRQEEESGRQQVQKEVPCSENRDSAMQRDRVGSADVSSWPRQQKETHTSEYYHSTPKAPRKVLLPTPGSENRVEPDKKSQENENDIPVKEIGIDKVKDKLQHSIDKSSNLDVERKECEKETQHERGSNMKQNEKTNQESPLKLSASKKSQVRGLMSPILDRLSRERPGPSSQNIEPDNEINLISGDLTIKTPQLKGKQLKFDDVPNRSNQTEEKEGYFEDENPIPSTSACKSPVQSPKEFEFEMDQVVSVRVGDEENEVAAGVKGNQDDQDESVKVGKEDMYSFLDETNSNLFQEDSEDEDLPEAPALSTIPTRAFDLKKTPTSHHSSPANIDELKDSPAVSTSISGTPADTGHFSLDMLLAEKTENEPSNRELEQMTKEVKEDLKKGGINKIADMSLGPTDDLSAEQKEQLEMLEVKPQEVKTHHPGDEIFFSSSFLKLFDQKSLTLQSCGFVSGQSFFDKKLTSLNQDMVLELLKSNVITLCFDAIGKPKVFLTWLFKLMSVHGNTFVVHSVNKLLYDVVHRQSGNGTTWVPSVVDVCQIFINYGAKFKDLCPTSRFVPFTEDEVCSNVKENTQPLLRQQNNSNQQYNIENLKFVLQVLADVISERSKLYKDSELVTLLLMIMKVSVDKRLNLGVLKYDFVVCVSAILNAFSSKSWPKKALELCALLPKLSEHHHNKVFLVQLLPPTTRGLYLQRRLSLCMLYQLLYKTSFANNVETILLKQLHPILEELHKKTNSDFYFLSSMVFLIDLCVGNETLGSSERSDLEQLVTKVSKMKGEVREYVNKMDRTLVKDQMVRLTSKWTFMLQNMGTKQRSIFAYTQQDMPVKKLESSHIEEDTESEQDEKMESECDTDSKETCTVIIKKEKDTESKENEECKESESAISEQSRTKNQMYVDITDSDDLPEL